MTDVFGLGQCVVDRLGFVDTYPQPDEKREFADMRIECGGPVATALVALARWGRRCSFAGVVGDDDEGRRITADLDREGVERSHLLVRAGSQTQYAFVAVERGSGRRMIFWQRPTGAPPGPEEVDGSGARVFLTDGLFPEASVALAERAECVVVDAKLHRGKALSHTRFDFLDTLGPGTNFSGRGVGLDAAALATE